MVFDSAAILLIPDGNYYGDTTRPFRISVYKLSETLSKDTASTETYYNINTTPYDNSEVVASFNSLVKPLKKDTVFVKTTKSFGEDLFDQLKNNTSAVSDQNRFRQYLKGLAFISDSLNNNAVYQFKADNANIIRIYYTLKGLYSEKKHFDFAYYASKQYNYVGYNFAGSLLGSFSPLSSKLVAGSEMDNKALLNSYAPTYIKIEFPDILKVKQAAPYVKILRAILEVRVNKTLNTYPYSVPPGLMMYISDQKNEFSSYLLSSDGSTIQNGNLTVNDLVSDGTKYSFDITLYINTIISEDRFSTRALFLSPYSNNYYSQISRLVVNNKDTADRTSV